MTTKSSELQKIDCFAGVAPSTDATAFSTKHWTFADKIRFVDGSPEKIGGWQQITFENSATISGAARSVFSIVINDKVYTLIGTEQKLYSVIGSRLINITPLQTATIAIANSLATHYTTLANDPITSTNGSKILTITDADASRFVAGDRVNLSGTSGFAGIPAGDINTVHIVRSVAAGNFTIRVATSATSSTSGGGAAVVRTSGLIRVTAASHGQSNGDRVKITLATNTGGILAADINKEHIIRNVAAGTFDIFTGGTATSSVSGGGGAATLYQKEIADGALNGGQGQGYGMGLYGAGLYGVSKVSSSGIISPRIWIFDKYGEKVILTAGNQTGIYSWDGNNQVAPVLISGAPAAINYAFTSNNIAVTLGAAGAGNHIFSSDINDFTNWVSSSTNQVFEDYIEAAGRFISHASTSGVNLLFTENKTYTFRYIGLPLIWDIKLKSPSVGIIAPLARCTVNEVVYWMDDKNFYMWRGGDIEIIPANSQKQSTILRYVFDNLNFNQKSKAFAWYNRNFHEVWFHYPSSGSGECDRVARLCLHDYSWVMDTMDRSAAEYPEINLNEPRLARYSSGSSSFYRHEVGSDDDASPLSWQLTSNFRNAGKDTATTVGIIPDSIQSGDITLNFKGYLFPQSTQTTYDKNYTINSTTERVTALLNGRFWQYTFSGSELGQDWQMGDWQEYLQSGASN
jgi:hypothetical protein